MDGAFWSHSSGRRGGGWRGVFGSQSFCLNMVSRGEGCQGHDHRSCWPRAGRLVFLPVGGSWPIQSVRFSGPPHQQGLRIPAGGSCRGQGLGGLWANGSASHRERSQTEGLTVVFGPRCRWPVLALSRVTRLSSGLSLLCLQSPLDALTKIYPHAHHACGPHGDQWH